MGKTKQQSISRFFAPKAPNDDTAPKSSPPPKVAATVSFSPSSSSAKRRLRQTLTPSPPPKKPKPLPAPPHDPSLHQRFLSKLLDPPAATSSSSSSSGAGAVPRNPTYTPLELQVLDLKSRHPDVLLMVEVGYRYRFFGADAEVAARVLGIIAHVDRNFLTASVPTFRLNFHVRRLVAAGYKVGVVKQTETAAIKAHGANRLGPFSRGLSALYTRSTIEAVGDMGGGGGEDEAAVPAGSNFLACVVEEELGIGGADLEGRFDVRVGLVAVEASTGDVVYGEFNDDSLRSGLEAVLMSLSPAEILMAEPLSSTTEKFILTFAGPSSNVRVERTRSECYKDGGALAEVMSLYESVGDSMLVDELGREISNTRTEGIHFLGIESVMSLPDLAIQALALTVNYLKEFGLERILGLSSSFRPISSNIELNLQANTLHQLEVLANNSDGSSEGSLFHVMNHTCTAFGSRLFKHWVTHPLCDRNSILSRLDAVSEIAESMSCQGAKQENEQEFRNSYNFLKQSMISDILSSVLTMLRKSPDIQRGISRILHRTATAAEFIGVIHAILTSGKQLQKLHIADNPDHGASEQDIVKSALLRRLISTASSPSIIDLSIKLLSSLNKDAADQNDMLNLFVSCADQFPEVFRGRIAVQMAREKLDLLITQYRKQLGMRNLEFITVSGNTHLLELPAHARVPSNWTKVSSTKKTTRYHPPEALTALDQLALAKEELTAACKTTWDSFLLDFGKHYAKFQASVRALAALDCLHSLAILSRNQNYVRPVFVSNDEPSQIYFCSGRHPVLEAILGDNFVPNDTELHADKEYCQIVTGPNMGGKSCYIRQVALMAIMAQVGSFVPASSAKLHVLDGIYTRMGASDSIHQGKSTFFEELSEASQILHSCSSQSLIIIDELGRGTSTHDGVAIAYATLHYLIKQKKCMTLFVTHYPKILDIQREFRDSVGTYHVSYLASQQPSEITDSNSESCGQKPQCREITFLYKVVSGASDKSFGLNVARLAQLPASCIARAAVMAARFEAEVNGSVGNGKHLPKILSQLKTSESRNIMESPCHKTEDFDDLSEVCRIVLSLIRSSLSEVELPNILCSLKDARAVALRAIKGKVL